MNGIVQKCGDSKLNAYLGALAPDNVYGWHYLEDDASPWGVTYNVMTGIPEHGAYVFVFAGSHPLGGSLIWNNFTLNVYQLNGIHADLIDSFSVVSSISSEAERYDIVMDLNLVSAYVNSAYSRVRTPCCIVWLKSLLN